MRYAAAAMLAGVLASGGLQAQPAPDALFTRQCGTCHVAKPGTETRQGPNLWGVVGRPAGTLPGFKYSPAFAASGITWDEATLDAYLTNPQATVPGSNMVYRQANAEIRRTIIDWLKDRH